jgi:hypothetical protein
LTLVLRTAVTALCVIAAACGPRAGTTSAATHDAAAPRVLGSCCPDTDAAIYSLMERHESTSAAARPPELALLPYRHTSGLTERERIVVRDASTWAALWPRILGSHRPMPPVPSVDFAREMVVVASMGTRSSGGYTIAIDSVFVARDTLRVVVREQSPGPRCGTTAALTMPVALARLERSELPVSFISRAAVRDCP